MEEDFNDVPKFSCLQDEVEFWRRKAHSLKKGFEEIKLEFEEYQDDSKTLEQELEMQLKLEEQKNKELTSVNCRLQNDNENLRSRIEQMAAEHNTRTAEWTAEIACFRKTGEEITHYVRNLEQKNDDLERSNRAAAMSIEDFETKLNQAIERNVYLESELDEKDNLKMMVQRLKDETRDLRYELQVTKKDKEQNCENVAVVDSNRLKCATPPPAPFARAQASLSPSTTRMSPLSIVNDLLRKVGALESKLTTYPRKDGNMSIRKGSKLTNDIL